MHQPIGIVYIAAPGSDFWYRRWQVDARVCFGEIAVARRLGVLSGQIRDECVDLSQCHPHLMRPRKC